MKIQLKWNVKNDFVTTFNVFGDSFIVIYKRTQQN